MNDNDILDEYETWRERLADPDRRCRVYFEDTTCDDEDTDRVINDFVIICE